MSILVLGLGNELLSDDCIGLITVQNLKKENYKNVDIIESNLTGVALIDLLSGYNKAIVIDSIYTGKYKPGTIVELDIRDLSTTIAPSPHYTGLPEIVKIACQLDIEFPDEIKIFAVEVFDPFTIGGRLCKSVSNILDELINKIKICLQPWANMEKT